MKKYSVAKTLLLACLAVPFTWIQAQSDHQPLLASAPTTKGEVVTSKASNEKEVIGSINQYIAEHLAEVPEFLSYYNQDLKFTISFWIDEEGMIENVKASGNCKNPIASALVAKVEKLEKVDPIVRDGMPVHRQYRIPILLEKN